MNLFHIHTGICDKCVFPPVHVCIGIQTHMRVHKNTHFDVFILTNLERILHINTLIDFVYSIDY